MSYLIFVTGTTGGACGDKSVMWRNFRFLCITDVEKSNFFHMTNFYDVFVVFLWSFVTFMLIFFGKLFFCDLCCFVGIYAVLGKERLSQKLCLWRKYEKYEVCIVFF